MITDQPLPERRKHPRYRFAYPVSFRFVSPHVAPRVFMGMMRDISMSGASILFDCRYSRLALGEIPGLRAKLEISPPDGETIHLLALIR